MIVCPECNDDLTRSVFWLQPLWRTCPACKAKLRRFLLPKDRLVFHAQEGFFVFMIIVFLLEGVMFSFFKDEILPGKVFVENAILFDPFYPFLFAALFTLLAITASGFYLIKRAVFLPKTDPRVSFKTFILKTPLNLIGTLAGLVLALPLFLFWGVNKDFVLIRSSMCQVDEKNPGSYNKLCMNLTRYSLIAGANIDFLRPGGRVTPLAYSLLNKNRPLTYLLLDHGADVNRVVIDGMPPLRWALHDPEMFRLLLEKGADSNDLDILGGNLLAAALGAKKRPIQMGIVRDLIASGNDVNKANKYGETPLHIAAARGNTEAVSLLLRHGADLNAAINRDGHKPVHSASNLKTLTLLLSHGAAINEKTKKGRNLLHLAAVENSMEKVRFLMDKGFSPNDQDNYGYTPLHLAYHRSMVSFLINNGADIHARAFSQIRYYKAIKENTGYLPNPADLGNRDWTPLHLASYRGRHAEVINNLLDAGADPKSLTRDGWTPLRLAILRGHAEIVWVFIDRGLRISSQELARHPFEKTGTKKPEKPEWTSLHQLAQMNRTWAMSREFEKKADPDAADYYGDRPLHTAVTYNMSRAALTLIGHGADINALNGQGESPLHLAILKGHHDLAHLLAAAGADVNLKNKSGKVPLMLAQEIQETEDRETLMTILKKYGAKN